MENFKDEESQIVCSISNTDKNNVDILDEDLYRNDDEEGKPLLSAGDDEDASEIGENATYSDNSLSASCGNKGASEDKVDLKEGINDEEVPSNDNDINPDGHQQATSIQDFPLPRPPPPSPLQANRNHGEGTYTNRNNNNVNDDMTDEEYQIIMDKILEEAYMYLGGIGISSEVIKDMLFRDINPLDYETLLALDQSVPKRTLNDDQLDKFVIHTIAKSSKIGRKSSHCKIDADRLLRPTTDGSVHADDCHTSADDYTLTKETSEGGHISVNGPDNNDKAADDDDDDDDDGTVRDVMVVSVCMICMGEIVDGDEIVKLHCNCQDPSGFHRDCIFKWLKENSIKCPLCNFNPIFHGRQDKQFK